MIRNLSHRFVSEEPRSQKGRLSLVVRRGYTLIELLVTVAIFTMMTTIVVSNYSVYRSNTMLTNLAYSVALGVRQAQVFGLSFKKDTTSSSSYGMHFSSLAGSNMNFVLFEDTAGNDKIYTAGSDSIVTNYTVNQGYSVSSICGYASSGATCTLLQAVDIVFTRPDPDASITGFTSSRAFCGSTTCQYSYVEVTVSTPLLSSLKRTIQVWSSGQISVQ